MQEGTEEKIEGDELNDDVSNEEEDDELNDEDKGSCKLFLRFPTVDSMPSDEEIKALHPDIIDVGYPSKKTRYCFLEFADHSTASEAQKALSDMEYKGLGHLFVDMKNEKKREPPLNSEGMKRRLMISHLADGTTAEHLKEAFPTCIKARILKRGSSAVLNFNSSEESEKALKAKEIHKVNGASVEVNYQTRPMAGKGKGKSKRDKKALLYALKKQGGQEKLAAEGRLDEFVKNFTERQDKKRAKKNARHWEKMKQQRKMQAMNRQ